MDLVLFTGKFIQDINISLTNDRFVKSMNKKLPKDGFNLNIALPESQICSYCFVKDVNVVFFYGWWFILDATSVEDMDIMLPRALCSRNKIKQVKCTIKLPQTLFSL